MPPLSNWHRQHGVDKLLNLINIARVSLLFSLLTFQVLVQQISNDNHNGVWRNVGVLNEAEFYVWAFIYSGIIIFSLIEPRWQQQQDSMPNVVAVVDISMVAWLMHMAAGVYGNLGILVLPFVTTSCLISYGRYPFLYAGYASLLMTVSTIVLFSGQPGGIFGDLRPWIRLFVLVASSFLLASLTSYIADFVARSRQTLRAQSKVLASFRNLTEEALNNMQEAVVVIDKANQVWLLNGVAQTFFPDLCINKNSELFCPLQAHWKHHHYRDFEINMDIQKISMRIRTRTIKAEEDLLLMLFMRRQIELDQEAMSVKLSALGQLTVNLAHEIRNPMSAIRHANDLLHEEACSESMVKLNSIIEHNIERIDKMLQDISTVNKRDKIRKHAINLREFWDRFYQEFILINPEAADCIILDMENPIMFAWCDPHHLQQILWNLMNNAWRHSRQDTQAIRVDFNFLGGNEIQISVIDNGGGVPPENQHRLFEPFFTTAANGTGLGLYVAQELANANLGNLYYQPKINGFVLVLLRANNE
ncbi:two-component system sensor histidine kinase NtrB [Stenoxybacter acetivorans]|uniref:two-component system sensor histidine kinase NtrB n=1 Tax=Stenoxybacter acetivorans TaxID=422441 RepID=UPI00055F4F96|nr:ATP-binding protein [Stenoxybacter acetivorans]